MAYASQADKAAHGRRYYAANAERQREIRRAYYHATKVINPAGILVRAARARAKKSGTPFAITVADIEVPEYCPVFNVRLQSAEGHPGDYSPSIDRIVPELGYVPGNVRVISHRANSLKSNATLEEIQLILADLVLTKGGSHGPR